MSNPTSLSLMIVDDDDDLRNALTFIMSAHGYQVAAFGDARRALDALETGAPPFLILLDLMMAGMSGWEFRAAQLQNSEGNLDKTIVQIMEKPFALDALLALVARYAAAARPSLTDH